MIASICEIPYRTLCDLPMEQKGTIYNWFAPIMEIINYKVEQCKPISTFKFNKQTFHLFEFGTMTAHQMLWFETWWKQSYKTVAGEIANMNFEHLSKLIAIIAFPKGEINTRISDGKPLPTEIKENYYKDFENLVNERTELFKKLPLSIAYGCLSFFFINSKSIQQHTATFTANKAMLN